MVTLKCQVQEMAKFRINTHTHTHTHTRTRTRTHTDNVLTQCSDTFVSGNVVNCGSVFLYTSMSLYCQPEISQATVCLLLNTHRTTDKTLCGLPCGRGIQTETEIERERERESPYAAQNKMDPIIIIPHQTTSFNGGV